MFDLFGGHDPAARESLVNLTGFLVGVSQLLIDKGFCTEEELLKAVSRGQQQMDQKLASEREKALETLKTEEPDKYKALQFMQKLLGG